MKLTLRSRIFIVLSVSMVLIAMSTFIIYSKILLKSFITLERKHEKNNIERVVNVYQRELDHISTIVNDWSSWDDTYHFLSDHNIAYIESNLDKNTFIINHINLMFFVKKDGGVVWGKILDSSFENEISIEAFDASTLSETFPLLNYASSPHRTAQEFSSGLIITEHGPLICAGRPILKTDGTGPPVGTLVMGRFLDEHFIGEIARITESNLEQRLKLEDAFNYQSWDLSRSGKRKVLFTEDDTSIYASTVLRDIYGKPALEFVTINTREIVGQGKSSLQLSTLFLAVSVVVSLAIIMIMLQRSIVSPIKKLENKMISYRKGKILIDKESLSGFCVSREVCMLNDEFDSLVNVLDKQNSDLEIANRLLLEETDKLRNAESELKKLDKLKSEFISTAAHELRTPVASIMGFTELLSGSFSEFSFSREQIEDFLSEISHNSDRLSRLIDDILDVSRIESGQPIPLEKSYGDIVDLLQKYARKYSSITKRRIDLQIADNSPKQLEYDSHRIGQVIENLISNAIKYSSKESPISIFVEPVHSGCQISVRDNGIGMTEDQQSRIFDKFFRADATDTAVRGLGLGMSIVKQIVLDHGGSIWVESTYKKGTQVYFTIPVAA